jgi:hypothetical protein
VSRRDRELEFNLEWGDLATYNSEKARGIVHTPEWVKKMAWKQKAYNELYRERA